MSEDGQVVAVRPVGGFTEVARHLTREREREVSKQRVWNWWHRRETTGFPLGWERPTRHGSVRQFHLDEVLTWYDARFGD